VKWSCVHIAAHRIGRRQKLWWCIWALPQKPRWFLAAPRSQPASDCPRYYRLQSFTGWFVIYIIFVGIFHLFFCTRKSHWTACSERNAIDHFHYFFPGTTSKLLILRTVLSVVVVCCLNQHSIFKTHLLYHLRVLFASSCWSWFVIFIISRFRFCVIVEKQQFFGSAAAALCVRLVRPCVRACVLVYRWLLLCVPTEVTQKFKTH